LSEDFLKSYSDLLDSQIFFQKNEIYVSHIISHLIVNKEKIFHFLQAEKYIDWGTLKEWQAEREKYSTYIFDIDGVMLVNYGKYGSKNWSNTFEPIQENFKLVKELSGRGNEIIFMTSRPEKYLSYFREFLEKSEINFKTIISDCNHCKRIIVNDFANTNPYPSCEGISVKRNSELKNYFK
jgi:hypothetical protein